MKWILLAVAFIITGCHTIPPKTEQLILKVPAELLKKPEQLEQL